MPPGLVRLMALCLLAGIATLPLGCSSTNSPAPADGQTASGTEDQPQRTADQVLERVVEAYGKAQSYRDQGVVRLSWRQQREVRQDEAPLAVVFERPNRILLDAYQVLVSSDGKQFQAQVRDEATGNLDNQWVVRPAEEELTLGEMYADPVIDDILRGGLGRYPVQLELLLGENPLAGFRDDQARRQLLEDGQVEQRPCNRVQVTTPEGDFVLWVDRESFVLRRLEFPTGDLERMMQAGGDVDQVRLVAEFADAELNPVLEKTAFDIQVPEDARQVRSFVVPPEPLPTNLYGRRPSRFAFTQLDGTQLTHRDLQGQVTVMVWFTLHPTCRGMLEQLSTIRRDLADREQASAESPLRFLAVSTEPSTVSNQALRKQLEQWEVDLPIVRDLEAYGRDVFAIPGAPTLVVLDDQGTVQLYEVGAAPEVASQLPALLDRIVEGEDLASQLLASFRVEQENYQRLLEAGGASDVAVLEVPQTPLRQASQPKRLQLTRLWSNNDFAAAGNLLVIGVPGEDPQTLVFDGYQHIRQLDGNGQMVARHALELPEGAGATYLRTAVDRDGRRYYAASGLRAAKVHVLDQNWKPVFHYPASDEEHPGIHDVLLADLDDKNGLELYAGFWGPVGIHAVDMQGNRIWSNRAATNVLTLALSGENEVGWHKLLASSDLGPLVRLNQFGRHDEPIHVGNHSIHHIYSTENFETSADRRPAAFCGLSYEGHGQMVAIGLDPEFQEQWRYALPPGSYQTEIQFVQTLQLPEVGTLWLLAGPDGSVHLVSADGNFQDDFGTGAAVTGLAGYADASGSVLLVASPEGVTAWRVALPK